MEFRVEIAGEEQMPTGMAERQEVFRLTDSNGDKINQHLLNYFGLDPCDRYLGSFPYADRETGRPRVAWCLSMASCHTRDAIVACLRVAILESGLADITVLRSDADPNSAFSSPWPARMEIVAMGPTINDTLDGERRINAALDQLEAWLSRA